MAEGCRSILLQAPTGSGKTLLTAHMLKTCAARGQRAIFVVHRRELVKQSIAAFGQVGLDHGVIAAGWWESPRKPVQIASAQTLIRRHHKYAKPNLVIWDEAHHLGAQSWQKLHAQYPMAYHIGLTATPVRLDGKGLGTFFERILCGPSVSWLIENKYLSSYKLFAPSLIETNGLSIRMGDFSKEELATVSDKPTITGDAISHYKRLASGKRALVFCVSIQHSQHVVAQFQAAGISAAHIDGETDQEVRDATIEKFKQGSIKVLSNVELFGEGFDIPSVEVGILLRPTQSLGLYLQQIGRTLRPSEGKTTALILDHAGNCQRHGFPDDEREWSLSVSQTNRRSEDSAPSVRICPSCFAAQRSGSLVCLFCGFVAPGKPREVTEKEGELHEIDPQIIRSQRAREQGTAGDFTSLVALGKSRGYKAPWAWAKHVMNARQAKKLALGR